MFHADGQTDGQMDKHDEGNSRIYKFLRTHLKIEKSVPSPSVVNSVDYAVHCMTNRGNLTSSPLTMAPLCMSQNVPWTALYPGDTKLDQTVSTQQGVSLQEHVKCGSYQNPVKDTRLW